MTDLAAMVDHFTGLATHPVVYLALPPAIYTNSFGISETVTSTRSIRSSSRSRCRRGCRSSTSTRRRPVTPTDFQDGVHPTDAGYMFVAQLMHDGLLRLPTVAITMPSANASIAGTSVGISANASGDTVPITSVQFFRGTTSIATVTQSPFTTTWTNAAPGSYTLTAKAIDKTGAAATSAPIAITVAAGRRWRRGRRARGGAAAGAGRRGGSGGCGGSDGRRRRGGGAAGRADSGGSGGGAGGSGGGGARGRPVVPRAAAAPSAERPVARPAGGGRARAARQGAAEATPARGARARPEPAEPARAALAAWAAWAVRECFFRRRRRRRMRVQLGRVDRESGLVALGLLLIGLARRRPRRQR